MWAEYLASQQRVTELVDRLAKVQAHNADLRDKLNRKSEAAMRESDDKNATIARLRAENAELKADKVTANQVADHWWSQWYDVAFTDADPAPTDLPDPPRRADGTLAPAPKPWTPPKANGDARRIGG